MKRKKFIQFKIGSYTTRTHFKINFFQKDLKIKKRIYYYLTCLLSCKE